MDRIHLIAIGGSAMHNLAIALHLKGYQVSGSDDEIFEPSKGRLKKHNLLPDGMGWDENRIHTKLDAVIVGMHARQDNPELLKAKRLKLPIFSYPEFLYNQAKEKKRLVICGSHGKTTITAMILHACKELNKQVDYMVGAQLSGYDCMVSLTDANTMVLEGDEYLSSPDDLRPKFMHYQSHVALLSGIAWDHVNVFPSYEKYLAQFDMLLAQLSKNQSTLIYNAEDEKILKLIKVYPNLTSKAYEKPSSRIHQDQVEIKYNQQWYPVGVFGNHNYLNMAGAQLLCEEMGISGEQFYRTMLNFSGASNRLEKIIDTSELTIYKDFAHSPSKLKATTEAFKHRFPKHPIVACMELHTFSSLNKDFLAQYKGALAQADLPIVYFNPEAVKHKKLPTLTIEDVKSGFDQDNLIVFTSAKELAAHLQELATQYQHFLMMSSGNFGGINLKELAKKMSVK